MRDRPPSPFALPMEGEIFGYLTVLRRAGSERLRGKNKYALWRCRCECGQEVVVRGAKLRRGLRKSCAVGGHFWRPAGTGLPGRHPSEYQSWQNMNARCQNPNHKNFSNYGGRGILIHERWKSFEVFLRDMGLKPFPDWTIERNNVNGNYEPGNCRWASRAEQYRNMRRSVYVRYEGKRILLADLVLKLGLARQVVYGRLKMGWSLESAISIAVRQYKPKNPS